MRLSEYLISTGISVTDFANEIGAKSRATVYRYMLDDTRKRLPSADMMHKIASVTGGKVTANDFYDITPSKPTKKRKN